MANKNDPVNLENLKPLIRGWAHELGFNAIGFSAVGFSTNELGDRQGEVEKGLMAWLAAGYHGDMDYMARHGVTRARPAELLPGTLSIISARMDYLSEAAEPWANLADPNLAYVSRYALGRDYHKLMRSRLQQLGERITAETGSFAFRAFSDSAPVMEVEWAKNAALGWKGKHTLLLTRSGSWFFLGELLVDLPFSSDQASQANNAHCGNCQACIEICPTRAILKPYLLDARRCISYLTIEHTGAIPLELRPLMGNRIYGCDDCQLVCPWNRFAQLGSAPDFQPRNNLDKASLLELFAWNEAEFLHRHAGSAIRRIGHERWLRNLSVALGNALSSVKTNQIDIIEALQARADHHSALVREHVHWALAQSRP